MQKNLTPDGGSEARNVYRVSFNKITVLSVWYWIISVGLAVLAPFQHTFAQTSPSPQEYYTIESQTEQGLTISFNFPQVEIRQTPAGLSLFTIPGLTMNYENGGPLLPVLAIPLTLPDGKVAPAIAIQQVENYPGLYPPRFEDTPNDGASGAINPEWNNSPYRSAPSLLQPFQEVFPEQIYKLKDAGLFREYRLSILRVYPVQVTAEGVKVYKKFTIRIRYRNIIPPRTAMPAAEADILNKLVANSDQLSLISPHPPVQKQTGKKRMDFGSDVNHRARIIVEESGIYQITGNDLVEAGINIEDIDPVTLRLTNRGNEVAYYLVGDQDGSFDPDDFFEFWGEPNQKTFIDQFPDEYADPFSDENVYWLEWGGTPGLRMVEENASIVTNRDGEYNPSFFYTTTVHVEKNDHFERLGEGSQEKLSYRRDLWYFDSGVRAVGKKQYPFQLIYPDPASFNNVEVTAMFSGKSFGAVFDDGIPGNDDRVPHNVMVWLNNSFVGSSRPDWFDQDTSRISNVGNSTISNGALVHGTNIFEVQLPTLPDITIHTGNGTEVVKGTDIVLLNWFDVTYDRQYKAYNNEIKFRRPSFISYPNVNLFQFDIENFTTPDIDVYKIGSSKLVNFTINEEVIDGQTFYKISLQDEVLSDDVEYVALTNDRKKKPLRIEKDEPFDPEDPLRTLKDPNNAAEYLIITHARFYDTALQLLEYRRNQGLAAEMVTVQNIYDEFNYGIKSPLAIKDFLRYAFFNWQRTPRLKYVLFLGDSNFDYKSKSQTSPDYVPTFFYQTQEFGAAATDFPYALISGDDIVPDLFVGRIPANTNSDVNNVVEKIIQYEQNPPLSAWRNRALFISGNDESTYELRNILGTRNPAFRSQNSRVIESLLPRHITAIRLNTIKDPDLPIDPNFGTDTDLIDHWDDGLFLINFMGHGGGGIWADVRLMDLPDVDRLNNVNMYPFVTSMTCFTGAFENPDNLGLAQKLLLAPQKGAIGLVASSGLGYLHNDYSMLWYIGQYLFDRSLRTGEMLMLGKILYWNIGQDYIVDDHVYYTQGYDDVKHEMMFQYNLIGDPYLQLNYADENLSVEPDNVNPLGGDTINVTIQSDISSADGYIELTDNQFNIVERQPIFGASPTTTVPLAIPDSFPEGTGLIRAYLSNGSQDGSGQAQIGVNFAAIQSVEIIPPKPDVDDTVQVNIHVSDRQGIRKVYLFFQGSPDTIRTVRSPADTTLFTATLMPRNQLETVFFNIFVENRLGNVSVFRNYSYVVSDPRPDIAIIDGSLHFTGNKQVQLKVGLQNTAGAGSDGRVKVNVRFYDGETNFQNGNFFAVGSIVLSSADSGSVVVGFPLSLFNDEYEIVMQAEVDSSEDVVDFNPANNTIINHLVPTIFNITPAAGSDTIMVDSVYRVYFPPGSVSDSSAVRVRLKEIEPPRDQKGIKAVPVINAQTFHALEVKLLNPRAEFNQPFNLEVFLNKNILDSTQYNLTNARLYEKIRSSQPWTFISSAASNNNTVFVAHPQESALFAPFLSSDGNAPKIELTVDGRPIKTSGLVSNKPALYVIVQDESGINLQRDKIHVSLDGKPLPRDQMLIPDSLQQNNVLGLTLYPDLLEGHHNLEVFVQDVNGNAADKNFELVVAQGFDVHIYGNYPNPFTDKTIFAYFVELNDDLDEFEIDIYTVSGRLVKRIDHDINNPLGAIDGGARRKGYNELIWDGTDEDGQEVANGVYFAVVRATYQEKTIEKILKVAKLK